MKRGQVSQEYLMIIGFSLAMVTVVSGIFLLTANQQQQQVRDSQVYQVGNTLISAAEEVYYLGEPSLKTITVYMPSDIAKVETHPKEIVFVTNDTGTGSDIEFVSKVNLTTNLSHMGGKKYIQVYAKGDHVCVVEKGRTKPPGC
ncbi:MAG: hypothetical protein R6V53_03250 [Candidatus Woesearchaeota archaeon]